jgi:hypothetical protein
MTREEFIQYTMYNFEVSGEFIRLLDNVLQFVAGLGMKEDDAHRFLCALLDGTIAYTEDEIKQISL